MANLDSDAVLHEIRPSSMADRAHAAWVIAGLAAHGWAGKATDRVPEPVKHAASDVLWMLDVATPDVLRHRPRGGRRAVRKRR